MPPPLRSKKFADYLNELEGKDPETAEEIRKITGTTRKRREAILNDASREANKAWQEHRTHNETPGKVSRALVDAIDRAQA